MLNLLFIGDVFGSPGRWCVKELVPALKERLALDLIVANGENAAGGIGLTGKLARELLDYGVDAVTTGNHVWKHADLIPVLKGDSRVLRPANYPPDAPGSGYVILKIKDQIPVALVNLEGRVFMSALDDPFRTMDRILKGPLKDVAVICVDFHAEATSEKAGPGLAPGRPGERGFGHPHPCAHRGRKDHARRNGLYHRPGPHRPARLGHRHGPQDGRIPHLHPKAPALQGSQGKPAPAGRSGAGGRKNRPGHRDHQVGRGADGKLTARAAVNLGKKQGEPRLPFVRGGPDTPDPPGSMSLLPGR